MGATDIDTDEQVVFYQDSETGLRAITVLDGHAAGPTVGSCRRRAYDDEERALADALRQAGSTSAKAAMAGLPLGGGCTVLLNDPPVGSARLRSQALGRAIDSFHGRYILLPAPEDTAGDMDEVALTTPHVLGIGPSAEREVAGATALDVAGATALGVRRAIELSVRHRLERTGVSGLRVAIMGLGPSGFQLAEQLRQQGAKIVVADRDPRRTERAVRELGIACVATEEIVHLDTDVFAPCSSKDVINSDTLPHLRCSIVAGTADDVLQTPAAGQGLHERGILYAPDFMINAGGLVGLVQPLAKATSDHDWVDRQIDKAIDRLAAVYDQAAAEGRSTSEVADDFLRTCRQSAADIDLQKSMALAG